MIENSPNGLYSPRELRVNVINTKKDDDSSDNSSADGGVTDAATSKLRIHSRSKHMDKKKKIQIPRLPFSSSIEYNTFHTKTKSRTQSVNQTNGRLPVQDAQLSKHSCYKCGELGHFLWACPRKRCNRIKVGVTGGTDQIILYNMACWIRNIDPLVLSVPGYIQKESLHPSQFPRQAVIS